MMFRNVATRSSFVLAIVLLGLENFVKSQHFYATNHNIFNNDKPTLWTLQAIVLDKQLPNLKPKKENQTMSTKSVETTLKVRKAMTKQHNQSGLKVRKSLTNNHNQTGLKLK